MCICVSEYVYVPFCICAWWRRRGLAAPSHRHEVVLVQRGSLPNTDAPQVPRLRQAPGGLAWLDGAGTWQKPPQWWSSREHEAKPGWGAPKAPQMDTAARAAP